MTTFPREGFGPLSQTETHFCRPKVISWRSKPWTWPIKSASATISRSYASDWSQEWSYLPRLLLCHTVIQCITAFAASLSKLGRCKLWSKSCTGWKGVEALGKSCSYSSFAFSCSRTPVTATSFSHCCRKHGDVSKCPKVRIRIIGVRIIENPLY